ncbi:hypothetical protein A2858_01410 [Candidatus Daviesbacteria bacterium RIFCSPHIGHO2_01_FULL_36_37]|uniref:Uncharacterized protein n=2 Tax=Candidatus Daviesiibacteriota TaxID=1752718 RepID=A0A1F5K746_9BACT|nr:MAG: hypothetical protein A2858_01410 [Candidatus Daviesbacteria bacterium RIFCSPHIGHO2_01_FULL_36_37]OGE36635.1 MAG: hypothetical protein A3E66_03255 [Candidatus Daviesbacteria bacterium RIFCSPHIGHO2_12_FULL_37_16]
MFNLSFPKFENASALIKLEIILERGIAPFVLNLVVMGIYIFLVIYKNMNSFQDKNTFYK